MRYIGVDFGAKRVGLAVSDERGQFAFPLETVPNDAGLITHIAALAKERQAGVIVVGDTRTFGGGANPITADADRFAAALLEAGLPVERMWEAGSSVEASRYAPPGSEHDDAAAAAIILQRFLDARAE